MIAVVPVREGVLPAGADETVSEASGRVIVVGSDSTAAASMLARYASQVWNLETTPGLDAGTTAGLVVSALSHIGAVNDSVLVPASPDGRDLAPHLAVRLDRPLFAAAIEVSASRVSVPVRGGLAIVDHHPDSAFVATLQVGVRSADEAERTATVTSLSSVLPGSSRQTPVGVESIEVLPPDAATIDLGEAPRILGGGAGLDGAARFESLAEVASLLDASMGVTRVITDRGWVGHERQIGTTGVVVDPDLYISFGVSGAVQHTSGLGRPDRIISINTDPHCPMMQMSDLAVVSDANQVLDQLLEVLRERAAQS